MIKAEGAESLSDQFRALSGTVDDLAPRKAFDLMLAAAKSRTPVQSGTLRSSGRLATGGSIIFSAPYAGPIHWGWRARNIQENQFALKGITATEDRWTAVYAESIEDQFK